jgi:response regulator RpfG family c-di-GMP phosphodiesterase
MGKRILIIDDDVSVCELIGTALTAIGHKVDIAHSGKAARKHLQSIYNLVILDVNLGDISGLEILSEIKSNSDSQVIMLSGRSDMKTVVEALEDGAYYYLTKPARLKELYALVDRALQLQELRRSDQRRQEDDLKRELELNFRTFTNLSKAMSMKLDLSYNHGLIVARGAIHIAEQIGWDMLECTKVELIFGSIGHDIGKLLIDKRILSEKWTNPNDKIEYRRHPTYSKTFLQNYPDYSLDNRFGGFPVWPKVKFLWGAHHEKLDGKGYPNRLSSDDLTISQRIIAVVDHLDGWISPKDHQGNRTIQRGVEELKKIAAGENPKYDQYAAEIYLDYVNFKLKKNTYYNVEPRKIFDYLTS